MGEPLTVGIVGAGKISRQYAATLTRLPGVRLTRVADLADGRAQALAADYAGVRAVPVTELLTGDDVDLVVNLTVPQAHADVALAALAAGRHVYGEKPLAASTAEARTVLAAAAAAGRTVGCAPDTVLGTGVQTARAALDAGEIGAPVAATAFMVTPGHERWHPDPEFYYQPGGGPLLDMGPYYVTALVTLLGPVRRVTGLASTPRPTRTIGDGPRAGTVFPVHVPTHQTGVLEHAGGALTTLMMSFDVWAGRLPHIEVYGTAGTLSVPDPNHFDGPVDLCTDAGGAHWTRLPQRAGYRDGGRGIGVADLADALRAGAPPRASAELAYHVLDVIECLHTAAVTGAAVPVTSTCTVPAPVPLT
ncbi:Gfo/Idh/MocA family oxidoreductase [Dactylosporangium aurantiacum]|uniref:Gfo/Idh/MocA family oxidoreductase n=1 Tax=Dactylosporangium aurantiacum TaxID=35754 RepID=A0A9Q9IC33_9ACTN|nr:Gfo/Idh/MocA family oxidoreductase [Dactylosporangium aurantiacum]MDG6106936.1 Gfo/Idh/MocA family oxidoreductase [Dactylosporangium aurantiacum]UWZ50704.1 Gfo/Idh/MocA family oxidoreductase [Dactylosporangium aurantiacum]